MAVIQFRFASEKALAALHWIVGQRQRVDLHAALKTCYFADKAHLNKYHRPIFGATYRAMRFGPVPLEIYEMAKGDPIWLAELGLERFPWILRGYFLHLDSNIQPNLDCLSQTDIEELETALDRSTKMTFTERTAATHGPDWQAANLGIMSYEDMIEDSDEKPQLIEHLQETSRYMRL